MKQYNAIKVKYPDAMLLFRVGDFYETFGDDAKKAAEVLSITLTKRGAGSDSETALAGFITLFLAATLNNNSLSLFLGML